jgi:hypothetical protein
MIAELLSQHDKKILYRPHHHHYQPINVPIARTQAFLLDYPQGTGHNPHRPNADWWMLPTRNTDGTNGLTCLPLINFWSPIR